MNTHVIQVDGESYTVAEVQGQLSETATGYVLTFNTDSVEGLQQVLNYPKGTTEVTLWIAPPATR
jgi:hypothetical protein